MSNRQDGKGYTKGEQIAKQSRDCNLCQTMFNDRLNEVAAQLHHHKSDNAPRRSVRESRSLLNHSSQLPIVGRKPSIRHPPLQLAHVEKRRTQFQRLSLLACKVFTSPVRMLDGHCASASGHRTAICRNRRKRMTS